MKISYQILCKNEDESLTNLLTQLVENKREVDEINVCRDVTGENNKTKQVIKSFLGKVRHYEREIKHTIHEQKNWLATKATGDYLFYLDADELLDPRLIKNVHKLIQSNAKADIFIFPRINTVEGATEEYIKQRNWIVNEYGWINFPDWQDRLFKNKIGIKYNEIPHGRLQMEGRNYTFLPKDDTFYAIIHKKTFEKQVSDNNWHDNKERELGIRK